jgi:hypothetical protein
VSTKSGQLHLREGVEPVSPGSWPKVQILGSRDDLDSVARQLNPGVPALGAPMLLDESPQELAWILANNEVLGDLGKPGSVSGKHLANTPRFAQECNDV